MGPSLGKAAPPPSLRELPPDVARLILYRLTSHADRFSFGAVCRDWRLAARRHCTLQGTMPWLNIGFGVYQSLDGEVNHFYCHGSSGCWMLYHHDNTSGGGRWLFLRNPFHASSASIELMWPCSELPKIIMCPSLPIAAILHRGAGIIAPFASMSSPSSRHPWLPLIGDDADMAFYRGKIFTVTYFGELISHDLFTHRWQTVMKLSVTSGQSVDTSVCHLVVSANKKTLLMVRWSIPRRRANGIEFHDHRRTMDLQVLEADFAKSQWLEVKDLGGQSLFVSKSCSRVFGSMEHSHPQGHRVYILGIDWHQKRTTAGVGPCSCGDCQDHVDGSIPSYCVYDMVTSTVSLVSLSGGHGMETAMSEWFFSCE